MAYKIGILYDCPGWAYYWRAIALQKYAPNNYIVEIDSSYAKLFEKQKDYDIILQLAFSYCDSIRQFLTRVKSNACLVSSYNVGWGYANEWLTATLKHSDHVIVNNYEMWDRYGQHPDTTYIANGVDGDIFKIINPLTKRRPVVKWIGSKHHASTKNYNTILKPLSKKLRDNNITVDFRRVDSHSKHNMNHTQMNTWYNTAMIYVVASSTEGTPNPALEAAAAGVTLVSTNVGNMPELIKHRINGYLCKEDITDIYNHIILSIYNYESLSKNMQSTIQEWKWENRYIEFFNFFTKLIESSK